MSLYFDHAATTEPAPSVVASMLETLQSDFGNPSSLHRAGLKAERRMEEARIRIAKELGVTEQEVVFTSGGTEAAQLAIAGTVKPGDRILTTLVEHSCVKSAFSQMEEIGATVEYLPVDEYGAVRLDALETALEKPVRLLSIQHVNNELGTIQPLEKIGQILKKQQPQALFHSDGVQAFGKFSVPIQNASIDLYSMSAHKINGPKGSGALFVRKGTHLHALFSGGGQENGRRGGTQNVPGIAGFGEALRLWQENREVWTAHAASLRKLVLEDLRTLEGSRVLSPENGSPFILNLCFSGIKSEVLLHTLEQREVYISTGSACSKGKVSPVLQAIGVPEKFLDGSVRISFSYRNTEEEARFLCAQIREGITMIRTITGKKR